MDVIRTLTFALRLGGEDQVLDAHWPHSRSGRKNGQRRLRQFCDAGLLARHIVHAKPVQRVALLFEGGPNRPEPDCAALSRESKRRWNSPFRPLVIYLATQRARNIFGGTERHKIALPAISHDLGVAALFFDFVRNEPELARLWRSEDEMSLPDSFKQAQPDALIVSENEQPRLALEFAADYEPPRFRRLHETLIAQNLNYRIYGADA